MSPKERNKELVKRFYAEAGGGDYSNLSEMVAPEYVDRSMPDAGRGPEVVRRHMEGLRQTFPDFTMQVEQIFADGEYVITQVSGRGTHRGEWMGIRPTGRTVHVHGINIDRVRDGRIVEHSGVADTFGMLLQMGVDPFPAKG